MATVRTAKGTANSKTSGTTLTLTGVNAKRGSFLVVGVVYDTAAGVPTAKWGNGDLVRLGFRHNADAKGAAVFARRRVRNPVAKDIVITWTSAIEARAMAATMLEGVDTKDQEKDRAQDATTTPDSGLTGTLSSTGQSVIAFFCAEGPLNDTRGTPTASTVSGQRDGTNGAPPISNVTIEEYFELNLTTTAAVKTRVTGAANRDWAIQLVTVKETDEVGVLSDLGAERTLTAQEAGDLEASALTWAQTAGNQTEVKTFFPSTKQDIDIKAMMGLFGLALMRVREDV